MKKNSWSNIQPLAVVLSVMLALDPGNIAVAQNNRKPVLDTDHFKAYVQYFNAIDTGEIKNYVPNDRAFKWLSENIPRFECPDTILQKIYYYRWWSFRKHLKQTPDGFIFTEFIRPVGHAGKHNAISCALGHHIYEGRWLHNPEYINQYISFWLFKDKYEPKPRFHQFSSWVDDAVLNLYKVNHDQKFVRSVLPALDSDYHTWEMERKLPNETFWQFDVRDGMEESISGSRKEKHIRPTIQSYMYGNAKALAEMATLAGMPELKHKYDQKATLLKSLTLKTLWDDTASFFKVRLENGNFSDAREAIGFIPWYFNLPHDLAKYAKAWDQLVDTAGFNAPWGQTTAERRHPKFRTHGVGGCEWDGALWPFATTQTLKGLSNLLTRYKHHGSMTPGFFYNELQKYALSHQKNGQPYLGEYQDEKTGYWLKGDHPRSSFYNHSGFVDLVINDLVGLKPRTDNILEVYPLVPKGKWDWFCLENVRYHGRMLTILWDKTGKKYGKGQGFRIYADGKEIFMSSDLKSVLTKLPG